MREHLSGYSVLDAEELDLGRQASFGFYFGNQLEVSLTPIVDEFLKAVVYLVLFLCCFYDYY